MKFTVAVSILVAFTLVCFALPPQHILTLDNQRILNRQKRCSDFFTFLCDYSYEDYEDYDDQPKATAPTITIPNVGVSLQNASQNVLSILNSGAVAVSQTNANFPPFPNFTIPPQTMPTQTVPTTTTTTTTTTTPLSTPTTTPTTKTTIIPSQMPKASTVVQATNDKNKTGVNTIKEEKMKSMDMNITEMNIMKMKTDNKTE